MFRGWSRTFSRTAVCGLCHTALAAVLAACLGGGCATFESGPTSGAPTSQRLTPAEERVQREMSREFATEELRRLQDRLLGLEREIGELQRQTSGLRSQIAAMESQSARAAAAGPSASDLARLEQRIHAVEQAQSRDREQIVQAAGKAAASELQKALAGSAPRAGGNAGRYKTYTVVAGDTLSLIAEAFKTTINELMRLNNLSDPNQLSVGQALRVPAP